MPSRESELYKDKIEVSLDSRQIFYMFFGGAVIVGMVFVLGVMVGRRVEARGHLDRAQTQTAADPLAALDRLEAGSGLSFQGALTGADTGSNEVEKTIAEIQKTHAVAPGQAAVTPALAPVAAPPPAPVAVPAVAAPADAPRVKDKDKDAKKAKDKDKDKDKDLDVDHDGKKPRHGDADHDSKSAKFTLQLSSFQDKGEAQAYLDSVKSAGYEAYLTSGEVDGKGTWYRVRVGSYKSLDAANDAKASFEKSQKKTAYVTRL